MKFCFALGFLVFFFSCQVQMGDFSQETGSLIFLCGSAVLLCISEKNQPRDCRFIFFLNTVHLLTPVALPQLLLPWLPERKMPRTLGSGWRCCPSFPVWEPDKTGWVLFVCLCRAMCYCGSDAQVAEPLLGWFWTWIAASNLKGRRKRPDRQSC